MRLKFTFQSGDIQIKRENKHYTILATFTFQSGDIQIKQKLLSRIESLENLHSNLVIFKFSGKIWI